MQRYQRREIIHFQNAVEAELPSDWAVQARDSHRTIAAIGLRGVRNHEPSMQTAERFAHGLGVLPSHSILELVSWSNANAFMQVKLTRLANRTVSVARLLR